MSQVHDPAAPAEPDDLESFSRETLVALVREQFAHVEVFTARSRP